MRSAEQELSEDDETPGRVSDADTQELARSAKRDAAGFTALYERIAPAVYAWAALRIRPGMRAMLDPQDVVQEVWSRAWKAFASFDAETTSFRAWLFRIAKNVMLESMRKLQRSSQPGAGPSTRLFQLQNIPESATAVSQRVARHEGLAHLVQWVEKLEEDERTLFMHCGLEGLSYAEVGERMRLQKDTVAKRWQSLRSRVAAFGVPKDWIALD
jgi:RNA polymerase sigma-70 factor, ECF subfamily